MLAAEAEQPDAQPEGTVCSARALLARIVQLGGTLEVRCHALALALWTEL
jgi:hypothetical protein